jgi:RHS repeat-associated protein
MLNSGYSANIAGATSTTNQLGKVTRFGYDLAGRLLATTNANNEVVTQAYGVSGELLNVMDAKNQKTSWGYDLYGRQTSRTNANGVRIITLQYDSLNRMTNRWSAAHGNATFTYDSVGNLLTITNPSSPAIVFQRDALNRVTNRLDAAGSTAYVFNNVGKLVSEGGLWPNDTVTYFYTNDCLLQSFSLAEPNSSPWVQSYSFDSAERLQTIASSAGNFGYQYNAGLNGYSSDSALVQQISLPNGAQVTNSFDSCGRLLVTKLNKSSGSAVDSHTYTYDLAGQITNVVRFDASTINNQYDAIGQLTSAKATDPGSVTRLHEQFSYTYDAAHNLATKTNNALVQSFSVDSLNQLSGLSWSGTLTVAGATTSAATNVTVNGSTGNLYADWSFAKDGFSVTPGPNTFTAVARDSLGRASTNAVTANVAASTGYSYDLSGNLLSDGQWGYDYDDNDQLIRITATNSWKSEFTYDGLGQRRLRTEYLWQSGTWQLLSTTRYVYASGLVLQERDGNNIPLISYTRGPDGGGGIGGLLARTDHSPQSHAYYHSDGCGNISTILNSSQFLLARYLYDPYGNTLVASGPLAQANTYRFSSKEVHAPSGLIYFGLRFYNPTLQRWVNADPIREGGGLNLFCYVGNSPGMHVDAWGAADSTVSKVKPTEPPDDIGGGFNIGNLLQGTGSNLPQFIGGVSVVDPTDFLSGGFIGGRGVGGYYANLGVMNAVQAYINYLKNKNNAAANQEAQAPAQTETPNQDQTAKSDSLADFDLQKFLSDTELKPNMEAAVDSIFPKQLIPHQIPERSPLTYFFLGVSIFFPAILAEGGGPVADTAAARLNVFGTGEAPGFLDVASDARFAAGRPLTSSFADGSASDIFIRSAPITGENTIPEILRLSQPGTRVTLMQPVGGFQGQALIDAFGSRATVDFTRTFTSQFQYPGVDITIMRLTVGGP